VPPLAPLAVDEAGWPRRWPLAVRAGRSAACWTRPARAAEFDKLHAQLRQRYPLLHATLTRELVGGHSLLYTWAGSDARRSRLR
jgi:carboxypeptidase PM20D1